VNGQNWYSIVRGHPEVVLISDRSLSRAWTATRRLFPEIGPEDLAFKTLTKKEFDALN